MTIGNYAREEPEKDQSRGLGRGHGARLPSSCAKGAHRDEWQGNVGHPLRELSEAGGCGYPPKHTFRNSGCGSHTSLFTSLRSAMDGIE